MLQPRPFTQSTTLHSLLSSPLSPSHPYNVRPLRWWSATLLSSPETVPYFSLILASSLSAPCGPTSKKPNNTMPIIPRSCKGMLIMNWLRPATKGLPPSLSLRIFPCVTFLLLKVLSPPSLPSLHVASLGFRSSAFLRLIHGSDHPPVFFVTLNAISTLLQV
jgi:hypothetical protein